ncbi:hypothetical protein F542_18220 [Bibersteinia trehalosi USDA-ARS-USMARC-188]|uniref:Uncharacterized protein n=3 Tax=Bibersteinia trehalosi TaxID=47735 RepID=W0R5B3_BIBTR|nr:hypothetical protein WQG_3730 [Bibersteinia trehalosi USDA-ARS-USMARC-192]AHG82535.1 hypothetical protein F542_18220 [Bibersteinia trehalosi USDA-ARS-USMARC-188]AHG84869.1 hypothetical protein F543_20100 [Bibersteinia trehalosi USDA-ARS-USMARC-189]AHG85647.1 hypothetical protein F544_4130 [Bibersteinia trehalosi USDA-ARS-USMARC-190]
MFHNSIRSVRAKIRWDYTTAFIDICKILQEIYRLLAVC